MTTDICDPPELADYRTKLTERELSQNTIDEYLLCMRLFFRRYPAANRENAAEWKQAMLAAGQKPRGINVKLNAYNTYCDVCGLPAEKIRTVRVHQSTVIENVISEREYARLLDGLRSDRNDLWYYRIRLLAVTGARVSEYVRLTKADFDRGYAEMWTKGKIRRIYIPASFRREARAHYAHLPAAGRLCGRRNGEPITTGSVRSMLRVCADRYGIDRRVMHPHAFRHLFAIEFLQKNSNLSLLADVMGHSNIATTAIYTRLTREQQNKAVNDVVTW